MKYLIVTIFILKLISAQWPCPSYEDIFPCICIYNDAGEVPYLFLDCSAVESEQDLSIACNAQFPFKDFQLFLLRNSDISSLKSDTLGELRFSEVDISYTKIQAVDQGAFDRSFDTMQSFIFTHSNLQDFSSNFSLFNQLLVIDMSNNNLTQIIINSETVEEIDLNHNNLSFISLVNLNNVKALELGYNQLEIVPSISNLKSLKVLHLENNQVFNLDDDAFGSPFITLDTLLFSFNGLQSITPSSFAGVDFASSSRLDLSSNNIQNLDQNNWENLIADQIANDAKGILDLTDNPILCGCEIQWLVNNSTLLSKINDATTCSSGNLLTEVDPNILESLCS